MDKMIEQKMQGILNNLMREGAETGTVSYVAIGNALRQLLSLFPQPLDEEKVAKVLYFHDCESNHEQGWEEILKATKHDGDCTNQAHTCALCLKEEYFDLSHKICTTFGKVEGEKHLRKLLWLNHGHSEVLYGDDGEMQCSKCMIDFKRDSIERIVEAFEEQTLKKLKNLGFIDGRAISAKSDMLIKKEGE